MADYQQLRESDGTISTTVLRRADAAHIPDDPANRDRAEYDQWLAEGNVPDPPDPLPEPEPVELPPVMPEDPNDAAPKAYVDQEIAALRVRLDALEQRLP